VFQTIIISGVMPVTFLSTTNASLDARLRGLVDLPYWTFQLYWPLYRPTTNQQRVWCRVTSSPEP